MITRICAAVLMLVGFGIAQAPAPPPMPHMGTEEFHVFTGPGGFSEFGQHRPGRPAWWKDPELAQKIGLSDAQVQKLNQLTLDHRLKMIDLHAALEREQVRLEPMMDAANPEENQILAQIDKIAVQRAQVQKADVQLELAIRRVLTPEQWKKLQGNMRYVITRRGFGGQEGPGPIFFRREFEGHHSLGSGGSQGGVPPSHEDRTPPEQQ